MRVVVGENREPVTDTKTKPIESHIVVELNKDRTVVDLRTAQ